MGKLLGIEILVQDALAAMEVAVRSEIDLCLCKAEDSELTQELLRCVEQKFYEEKAKLWVQLCPKLQSVLKQAEPKYTTLTVPDEVQYQLRDVESISCPAASRKRCDVVGIGPRKYAPFDLSSTHYYVSGSISGLDDDPIIIKAPTTVTSGARLVNAYIEAKNTELASGATCYHVRVNSRAQLFVRRGALASGIQVSSGGGLLVNGSGAVATCVQMAGAATVLSNGLLDGDIMSGGSLGATFGHFTNLRVCSGGTATFTNCTGNTLLACGHVSAAFTHITELQFYGGHTWIGSGCHVKHLDGDTTLGGNISIQTARIHAARLRVLTVAYHADILDYTVLSKGEVLITSESTLSNGVISSGGTVRANGSAYVYDCCIDGGELRMLGGAPSMRPEDRGKVMASGITVRYQGNCCVFNAATVRNCLLDSGNLTVDSGGEVVGLEIYSQGMAYISSGAYVSNVEIHSGGTMWVQDGANVANVTLKGGVITGKYSDCGSYTKELKTT